MTFTTNTDDSAEGVVILHFGPAPIELVSKAAKVAGHDAVLDPRVAQMAGAVFAAGARAALDKLRARLEAGAVQHAQQQTRSVNLPDGAVEWLGAGERGVSSETIFSRLTGFNVLRGRGDHPHDPADFRRCELLLDAVPDLRTKLPRMAELGPVWAAFVARWGDIVASLDAECPGWRAATHGQVARNTYALMRNIIATARSV